MQRYNFQFTGQRFYRIEGGKLAGQVKDVAYQATTTDFWGAMEAVGGAVHLGARGRLQLRQGSARAGGPGLARLPLGPRARGARAQRARGVGTLSMRATARLAGQAWAVIPAQELVEHGLTSAGALGADGCIVLVDESSHVDVRFALNTTTTNGVQRGRSVSVIAFSGESVGSARRSGEVGADGVAEMAAAALADARAAPPAADAFTLVEPCRRPDRGATSGSTRRRPTAGALEDVLSALSGAFGRARARDAVLAGFAEHDMATLYLGSSTGVRLSHAQPTEAVSLVGRTADGSGSAWVGRAHHRALARADGAGDLAPARLGHHGRSRWRPAATR